MTSAAGALTDVLTRAVAQRLSEIWKQSVVVENRGGAGYSIAAQAVMRAEHDGTTLLASRPRSGRSSRICRPRKGSIYDAEKDFVPVSGYGTIPMALLVNPSVPVNSLTELIALAKAKPGAVTFGSSGAPLRFTSRRCNCRTLPVSRSRRCIIAARRRALTDVLSGHINAVIMGPSVALERQYGRAKLKMLAFGSAQRVPQFPDVPTFAETVPGYEAGVSFGLFARGGTPAPIVNKINADVQKIVNDPDFQKQYFERFAVQPITGPPEAFAEYLRHESARWGGVIKAANVKLDESLKSM